MVNPKKTFNEQKVNKNPISINPKDKKVWLLFNIYWSHINYDMKMEGKKITKGEFIENLLKREIKDKIEKGEFKMIDKNEHLLKCLYEKSKLDEGY